MVARRSCAFVMVDGRAEPQRGPARLLQPRSGARRASHRNLMPPTRLSPTDRSPYLVTLNPVVAVCVRVPLFPVMVSVKAPLCPDDDVRTVSVDVLVVAVGVNLTVEPDGWPPRLRVTDPE